MITGATGDFGKAFALRFAALGCKLVLHGRDAKKLDALAAQFTVPVHTILFDIMDKAATIAAIKSIPDDFFPDVLINNAGGALGLDKAYEAKLEDWEDMIEMNDKSLVRITNLILPGMVKRQRGHIINIGSTAGNYPYPGGHVYCAVKAFVKQFSLALRADLVGTKVRVSNLEPGQVETQFSIARFKGDTERAAKVYANTVSLTADDVAEAAQWVATLPLHVNINRIEMMPTMQSFAGLSVERTA
jgi:3-hydroxy acid dehydrogenase/malonic semialdehyde reductase